MKTINKFTKIMMVMGMVLLLSSSYAAAYSNSGEFMFKLSGNDSNTSETILESYINNWFSTEGIQHATVDLIPYSKLDEPATSNLLMTVTYESDGLSGIWTTQKAIEFYSVKTTDAFAFYWVEGGATSGTWSTEDMTTTNRNGKIIVHEISHLSTWNPADPGDPTTTPEPGTMILLGAGLTGLAVLRKKFRK